MNPRVKAVTPNPDHTLTLTFTNDEMKLFDVKPYLTIGIFQELKDLSVFNTVKPCLGSIQWQSGQDFCPDTLYLESKALSQQKVLPKHKMPSTKLQKQSKARQLETKQLRKLSARSE